MPRPTQPATSLRVALRILAPILVLRPNRMGTLWRSVIGMAIGRLRSALALRQDCPWFAFPCADLALD